MYGTTLAQTTTLLKAEMGMSLTVGTADDQRYYNLIEIQQEWFASMYDWNALVDDWETQIVAGVAGRYTLFPSADSNGNAYTINWDREVKAYVKYAAKWQEVNFGIGVDEMNVRDSDDQPNDVQDPIMKWQEKSGDRTRFETWPLGATTQKIRFTGQRKLNTLRSAGTFNSSLTLDLDNRLVALSIAVDLLTAKEDRSVSAKSERLQALWKTLRSAESKSTRSFSLGATSYRRQRPVPITIGGSGSGVALLGDSGGVLLAD